MFAVWTASAILFAAFFGAQSVPVRDDPVSVDAVKKIIENADNYLDDHHLSQLDLPNIGLLPIDPVKLQNGQFGKLSTLELQEDPVIEQIKNKDGSSTYKFDVKLGLKELAIHYDFLINLFGVYKNNGQITLAINQNEMEVTGIVVVAADKTCDATLYSAEYLKYGDFKIDVQPNSIPEVTQVTESVMNYFSSKILPITNKALEASIFFPGFQNRFSEFLCKQLTQ